MDIPYEDLISGDAIPFQDICHIRSPQLKELKPTTGIGFQRYNAYLSTLMWNPEDIKSFMDSSGGLTYKGKNLLDLTKLNAFDLFSLMGMLNIKGGVQIGEMLPEAIGFFITENCKWENKNCLRIKVYEGRDPDEEEAEYQKLLDAEAKKKEENPSYEMEVLEPFVKRPITWIDRNNFDEIKDVILQLNFIQPEKSDYVEPEPMAFADKKARELWEQAQKYLKQQKHIKKNKNNGEQNKAYALGNVISKLCCASPSYNLSNVYDLTVYQVYDQFFQVGYLRVCTLNEMAFSHWGGKSFKMEKWMDPWQK